MRNFTSEAELQKVERAGTNAVFKLRKEQAERRRELNRLKSNKEAYKAYTDNLNNRIFG